MRQWDFLVPCFFLSAPLILDLEISVNPTVELMFQSWLDQDYIVPAQFLVQRTSLSEG